MPEDISVRTLFVGDLITPTGFSTVNHGIIANLDKKYNVVGLGVNYFGDPHNYPFPVFPARSNTDVLGIKRLEGLIPQLMPELIFMLNDVWVIDKYLEKLKLIYTQIKQPLPKIVVYFPVDAEEHDKDWYKHFDIVSQAVVYTEFGKNVVEKCVPFLPLKIIPHGVDSSAFFQMFPNRSDAKRLLYTKDDQKSLVEDSFIFLNANRNQPRKKIDLTIEAFKLFCEDKPDNVRLYLHMGVADGKHIEIIKYAERLGIRQRLLITSLKTGPQDVSKNLLNLIYNSTDAGINSGIAEGWCLPNMEHAVTGAPQLVADHSALHELYKDCGILVPAKIKHLLDNSMTIGRLITPVNLATKMERIYSDKELYQKLSKKGQAKFTSPEYQWSTIGKVWSELFNGVMNADTLGN